jgi:hypothetical protein
MPTHDKQNSKKRRKKKAAYLNPATKQEAAQ